MKILNLTSILSFESKELFNKYKEDEFLTISPFDEDIMKNNISIKCEIGSLSYVLAMICALIDDREYFSELDTGYLSGESSVGEEEVEEIVEFLNGCELMILDENLLNYQDDEKNIKSFLKIIQDKFNLKIINLQGKELKFETVELSELKEPEDYDGAVVFKHNLDNKFVGGRYFCMVAKIKDGDYVNIKTKTLDVNMKFELDDDLKGTIALLGIDDNNYYRYELAKISKV
ncbi:NADH:quinone oxidoreductase I, chain G-like protein (cl35703 superfamily) [Campylobacter blaseri]|uniref:NADH dehydrogenase n=1 Tax=Campylobacter blaseri TaxID=2042961 RepID=A0A2P8R101_9BACT|nr:hypothetical protein [Campylobacter blaseri]PSM52165.1 hypothetical protein CQ405_03680 [Campylobacter blaseri]PSM53931.1 hypothetical protein CRN67_03680 [Campylobacter blaseri]QKF85366.1 NADH:quinone oxidoreductase I, chain G-like protein (cl35703 superfamily) [Campylobacter blaseri]